MAWKLAVENGGDVPVLMCDVCSQIIVDYWGDKVSGTRGTIEAPGNIVVHHASCSTAEPVTTSIIEFFGMFLVRRRLGNVDATPPTMRAIVEVRSDDNFQ